MKEATVGFPSEVSISQEKKWFFSAFQDVCWTLQGSGMLCKEGVAAHSA